MEWVEMLTLNPASAGSRHYREANQSWQPTRVRIGRAKTARHARSDVRECRASAAAGGRSQLLAILNLGSPFSQRAEFLHHSDAARFSEAPSPRARKVSADSSSLRSTKIVSPGLNSPANNFFANSF